jgi:hypothetical protein
MPHQRCTLALLDRIIANLRKEYGADFTNCVAVTAATGIAATHISGELGCQARSALLQMSPSVEHVACRFLLPHSHLNNRLYAGTTLHSLTGIGVPQSWKDFGRVLSTKNKERWKHFKACLCQYVCNARHPTTSAAMTQHLGIQLPTCCSVFLMSIALCRSSSSTRCP